MRGTVFSRLRLGATKLLRDQRGNAFMLTAAAIIPVIGFVGSAVDTGRAYMTQLRLQQACDAGVLAGRRAMGGASYGEAAQAEADKMFNFNFPEAKYGASGILFSSQAVNASDVAGQASAVLPTELMFMFGKDEFRLSVNCTAKLEISNVDVMMVLDVTGSMSGTNSGDSVSKIQGLRTAAVDFFDTLTAADIGDGRLRFGVVPYSSSVNVGAILMAKDPDWIADTAELPSRRAIFRQEYTNPSYDPSDEYTDSATTYDSSWTNNGTVSAKNSTACGELDPPADTSPSPSDDPDYSNASVYVNGDKRVTTYDTEQEYTFRTYRYTWSNSKCRKQYKNAYFTRHFVTTVTETRTDVFDGKYEYKTRDFPVADVKLGSPLTTDTGDKGVTISTTWQGCVIERATSPFASNETAPADAFDMDIDMKPTRIGEDAIDTQWRLFLPAVTYSRSSPAPYTSTTDSTNFQEKGGDYAACPVAAMNLTTMTSADRDTFANYIATLQPRGYTYHDAGMAWGARLISPTGLFSDENATATNGRPISRHIVFMTDGDMNTPRSNMSHQSQESAMNRIGATSDSNAIARHNNRFVQLCRSARQRGMTVWVVSFGVGSNSNLNNCASSGQAFEADNAAELNEQFQAIARQISKLRLSQ
ncbi:MAG: TadE/TadG family protein [Sphingopyxis sp.]|nr:TadE/TadG family protein [Sphingopyxis sp.]